MDNCGITDEVGDSLFVGLTYFKTLAVLTVSNNKITNRSCYSLEDMIKQLPKL